MPRPGWHLRYSSWHVVVLLPGSRAGAEIRFRATPEEMLRLHPAMAPNAFEPSHVIPPLPKLARSC